MRTRSGQVAEWLKAHAWKVCIRQKRIGGSNPPLSAKNFRERTRKPRWPCGFFYVHQPRSCLDSYFDRLQHGDPYFCRLQRLPAWRRRSYTPPGFFSLDRRPIMFEWFQRKFSAWSPEHRRVVARFPGAQGRAEPDIRPMATGMTVAFYTKDSVYEAEKNRLVRSAERLGLPVDAEAIDSTGSWVRNASMKAGVLVAMRKKHVGPMLYVDVDAVFHRDPWPALAGLDCDIGAYFEPDGHLLSGTLFINHTPAAATLLQEWADACAASPDEWDQLVLERILADDAASAAPRFRLGILPVAYCWPVARPGNRSVRSAGWGVPSDAAATGCVR
ncbi:nucleotide-diphospho-sugar transferase domain-containing protein [Ditylenchus destructor]|nr:nucleotide-diphospho-sugar transferase domain-containing protein [Ditylenchus destructor]